jgi:hypothetical protein
MVRANKVQVSCSRVISLGKCRSPARGAESKSKGEKERREMQGRRKRTGRRRKGGGQQAAQNPVREQPVRQEWMLSTSPGSVDTRGTILTCA